MENGEVKYIYTYINIYLYIKDEIRFNVSQEEQQKKTTRGGKIHNLSLYYRDIQAA